MWSSFLSSMASWTGMGTGTSYIPKPEWANRIPALSEFCTRHPITGRKRVFPQLFFLPQPQALEGVRGRLFVSLRMHSLELQAPVGWHLERGPLGGDPEGVAPRWDGWNCEDTVTATCRVGKGFSRGIEPPGALTLHFPSSRTVGKE